MRGCLLSELNEKVIECMAPAKYAALMCSNRERQFYNAMLTAVLCPFMNLSVYMHAHVAWQLSKTSTQMKIATHCTKVI